MHVKWERGCLQQLVPLLPPLCLVIILVSTCLRLRLLGRRTAASVVVQVWCSASCSCVNRINNGVILVGAVCIARVFRVKRDGHRGSISSSGSGRSLLVFCTGGQRCLHEANDGIHGLRDHASSSSSSSDRILGRQVRPTASSCTTRGRSRHRRSQRQCRLVIAGWRSEPTAAPTIAAPAVQQQAATAPPTQQRKGGDRHNGHPPQRHRSEAREGAHFIVHEPLARSGARVLQCATAAALASSPSTASTAALVLGAREDAGGMDHGLLALASHNAGPGATPATTPAACRSSRSCVRRELPR